MYRELLIGCGNDRSRKLKLAAQPVEWQDLTTLDIDPNCGADVPWDLEKLPLPFDHDYFNEIHAYEVLEHTGRQGDWRFFFAQFSEFYRILRPGGVLHASVPAHGTIWEWGDPGHTRVITNATIVFLSQDQYTKQVGRTPLSDYRHVYRADFEVIYADSKGETWFFVLQAIKPSRISI